MTRGRVAEQWSQSNPRCRERTPPRVIWRGKESRRSALVEPFTPTSARCSTRIGTTEPPQGPSVARSRHLDATCRPLRRGCSSGRCSIRPGNRARARHLEPDRAQGDASRTRHAGGRRRRAVLWVPARRRPAEADRTLGRRPINAPSSVACSDYASLRGCAAAVWRAELRERHRRAVVMRDRERVNPNSLDSRSCRLSIHELHWLGRAGPRCRYPPGGRISVQSPAAEGAAGSGEASRVRPCASVSS